MQTHHDLNALTDDEFLRAFRTGEIANHAFHHRDHLRLAYLQIARLGLASASDEVTSGIRRFAEHHGRGDRYNDTMTRFWLRVVDLAMRRHPGLAFDGLLEAEPHLLDKALPFKHWSPESLMAVEARAAWREPDLGPIPAS
ncbi:MAG TPA: hypothetical protein VM674_00085 [Candidatus Acidoferrum sp.]|nr:hypothetical protein [Candidatus Acidoferrum sp.]